LNIIHNIFIIRDTEVVICIILVLLKRVDGLNQYINIIYKPKRYKAPVRHDNETILGTRPP